MLVIIYENGSYLSTIDDVVGSCLAADILDKYAQKFNCCRQHLTCILEKKPIPFRLLKHSNIMSLEESKKKAFVDAIVACEFNLKEACEALGMSVHGGYLWITKYELNVWFKNRGVVE